MRGTKTKNIWIPVFTGMTIVLAVFVFGVKTARAGTMIKPPNNLGLVLYHSYEDATGTIATDFSGNGNAGTLTNMEAGDWVAGIRGKALEFDGGGSSEYVTAPTISIPTDVSAGAWVYSSNFDQEGFIVQKATVNTQWELFFNSDSKIYWRGGSATAVTCDIPTNSQWHHVFGTQTGTTATIYIDGVQCNSGAVTAIGNGSGRIWIGAHDSPGFYYNGKIDEVRVYNRVLSATEIAALYSSGKPGIVKHLAPNKSSLAGYWPLREGTSTIAGDFSGNQRNGTLTNFTLTSSWLEAPGSNRVSLYFNPTGNNDYIDLGSATADDNLITNAGTISMWVYPTADITEESHLMSKIGGTTDNGWQFVATTTNSIAFVTTNAVTGRESEARAANNVLKINAWNHVAAVHSGTTAVPKLYVNGLETSYRTTTQATGSIGDSQATWYIGSQGSNFNTRFYGFIDDVRFYARKLSATEIYGLYQGASTRLNASQKYRFTNGLVALWTFDGADISGSTVGIDRSISGNHLSFKSSPVPAIGKVGQALYFGGANHASSTSNVLDPNATDFSATAWFKTDTIGGTIKSIVSQADGTGTGRNWLHVAVAGELTTMLGGSATTGATTLSTDTWYHGAVTKTGTNITLYLNGAVNATSTRTVEAASGESIIGRSKTAAQFFKGSIDEVRIYNRVLSPAEIDQMYRFGR